MTSESWEPSSARQLRFPSRSDEAAQFEAVREAVKEGRGDELERRLLVPEQILGAVAETMEAAGAEPRSLLHHLAVPCPSVGVAVSDVYTDGRSGPTALRDSFRLSAPELSEIERTCEDGITALECELCDPDREASDRLVVIDRSERSDDELACFLLREMEEFCETALDLGIAPLVKVVGESEM